MISELVKPERTKSSVFSLTSITTAMTAKKKMAKNLLEQIVVYDNPTIYKIVIELIKNGVITFNDIKSNLMARVKQSVAAGPYTESVFARTLIIKKIVERGDLPAEFLKA